MEEEEKTPPKVYQCLLNLTQDEHKRRIIKDFYEARDRVQIGKDRLDFPVIPAQMRMRCHFWTLLLEDGSNEVRFFTEHDIKANDLDFHKAWLIANGFQDLELGKPVPPKSEYLDYLLFRASTKLAEPNIQNRIEEMKRKIQHKKAQDATDAENHAQATAVAIIQEYLDHPKTQNGATPPLRTEHEITTRIRQILLEMGFTVHSKKGNNTNITYVKMKS
jgi:hypothetical protein